MGRFKIGDIVARKSYGCDILFEVTDIGENCMLKGIACRLEADAPESDLLLQTEEQIEEYLRSQGFLGQGACGAGAKRRKSLLRKSILKS